MQQREGERERGREGERERDRDRDREKERERRVSDMILTGIQVMIENMLSHTVQKHETHAWRQC
jgi:hypothetical protein